MQPVVLILDPSLVGRTIAKAACDALSFTALSVDSESALDVIEGIGPDIIIFDCSLGLDLEAFSNDISEFALEKLPVILVTGEASDSSHVQESYQKASLAMEYLLKPFEAHTLQAVLAKMANSTEDVGQHLSDAEQKRRVSNLRKAEVFLLRSPSVQGHLDLAKEYLEMQMAKAASRHFHAAALLETPATTVPLLSGVLKPNHRLHTVLQTISSHRWTGNLVLESGYCLFSSYIYFEDGYILDASGGILTGKKCIGFFLNCTHGEYRFFEMPIYQQNNINQTTEELLLEFATQWDQAEFALQQSQ